MNKLKIKIQEIIFEADTPMGKLFDFTKRFCGDAGKCRVLQK